MVVSRLIGISSAAARDEEVRLLISSLQQTKIKDRDQHNISGKNSIIIAWCVFGNRRREAEERPKLVRAGTSLIGWLLLYYYSKSIPNTIRTLFSYFETPRRDTRNSAVRNLPLLLHLGENWLQNKQSRKRNEMNGRR